MSLEVALGGQGTEPGFLHRRKPGSLKAQITDDGVKMDSIRRPFAVRIVEGIKHAPHLDWRRFEPVVGNHAFDLCAGVFYLCDQIDLPYIFNHGIHNAGSNHMRTYFVAFIPSDPSCDAQRLRWASTSEPDGRRKLTCISLRTAEFAELGPTIGQTGRFSISGRIAIPPKDILSVWIYDDMDFLSRRLVYHQGLIETEVTGYCGGDRSAATDTHREH